jgi:hypothetical protein
MARIEGVKAFAHSLDRIDWDPSNREAILEAEELLRSIGPSRLRHIGEGAIRDIWDSDREDLCRGAECTARIRPTPTHIKFLVGGTALSNPELAPYGHASREGYQLWYHTWKDSPERPFADRPHLHRSDMTATPVADVPYDMQLWVCPDPNMPIGDLWQPSLEEWAHPLAQRVEPG